MSDVLDELLAALADADDGQSAASGDAAAGDDPPRSISVVDARPDSELHTPQVRPDPEREWRKGVPEVVYAPGKRPEQAITAARALLERSGRALLSRVDAELEARLREAFSDCAVEVAAASRMTVVRQPDSVAPRTGGCVGVLTAGTSDVPVAEEAAIVAREMGCAVVCAFDVGVAGLHRLAEPLRELRRQRADVVIVAAGMDGALPSVVAGLVNVPVIGLPTSVGYGAGGKGVAALLSMLQTCVPGLSVVNIDNGVGAGATAALIANRVAAARQSTQ
jgi:NCAIR mutase (PurE)-related protein